MQRLAHNVFIVATSIYLLGDGHLLPIIGGVAGLVYVGLNLLGGRD